MQTEKEYAKALFLLATEEDRVDEYWEKLQETGKIFRENPDYLAFLSSPAISLRERLSALDEALADFLPESVLSCVKLLCENGHICAYRSFFEEYRALFMKKHGRVEARIVSAIALTQEQKQALCTRLEKLFGKKVEPVYEVDPGLIGGVKIEIDGRTYDGSLKARLRDVKDVMIG